MSNSQDSKQGHSTCIYVYVSVCVEVAHLQIGRYISAIVVDKKNTVTYCNVDGSF